VVAVSLGLEHGAPKKRAVKKAIDWI
jgi:hypothetical protein